MSLINVLLLSSSRHNIQNFTLLLEGIVYSLTCFISVIHSHRSELFYLRVFFFSPKLQGSHYRKNVREKETISDTVLRK